MEKLLAFLAAGLGGWVGWGLGAPMSVFMAVLLGAAGTGAGVWAADRLVRDYF